MMRGEPKTVAWMRRIVEGDFVHTGEMSSLEGAIESACRKIPVGIHMELSGEVRKGLLAALIGACGWMSTRKHLSVVIEFFHGEGIVDEVCFHVDPSLIPEDHAKCLWIRLTPSGEMSLNHRFEHRLEDRELMRNAFPKEGGNRE